MAGVLFPPTPAAREAARRARRRGRRPAGPGPAQGRLGEAPQRLDRPARPAGPSRDEATPRDARQAPLGAGGGRLTLGDVIAGAWEGLLAAGSAACPVCGGRMELDEAAGRCDGCGTRLE